MSGNKVNDEDDEMLALGYSWQCGRAQHVGCKKDDCVCGCHVAAKKQAVLEARATLTDELATALERTQVSLHMLRCRPDVRFSECISRGCEAARTALTRWRAMGGGE